MQSLGKVISILNDTQVLIRADESLAVGDEVLVFQRISVEALIASGVPYVDMPKGRLRISMPQHENVFVAERFRVAKAREIALLDQALMATGGLLSKKIAVDDPSNWSARLDDNASLGIQVDPHIRVGDHVGKVAK